MDSGNNYTNHLDTGMVNLRCVCKVSRRRCKKHPGYVLPIQTRKLEPLINKPLLPYLIIAIGASHFPKLYINSSNHFIETALVRMAQPHERATIRARQKPLALVLPALHLTLKTSLPTPFT